MMQNSEQQLLHAAPPTTGLHSSMVYALLKIRIHGSIPTENMYLILNNFLVRNWDLIKPFIGFGAMATPDGRRDTDTPPGRGMTNSW